MPPRRKSRAKPKGSPVIAARGPREVKEALAAAAKAEGRTPSNLLLHVLTAFLRDKGFLPK